MANLLNLERVSKSYGVRPLLTDVSLGVGAGERIGVVGRNGDGKTTLLEVMTGLEEPDTGPGLAAARAADRLPAPGRRARRHPHRPRGGARRPGRPRVGRRPADPRGRRGAARRRRPSTAPSPGLSGGERRRCSLAALLLGDHDLVVLDEPTNHLDVEAVAWLAEHLARRPSALVVVTHDRWFLDAVCQWTWEVHDGVVDVYEGGYAAFVLAKAERQRQAAASEVRRQNLVRKELAWLRRGAAGPDLEAEVPHRRGQRADRGRAAAARPARAAEVRDPAARQGRHRRRGRRPGARRAAAAHARHLAARPGRPGRLVGVNGAGKTSVLSLLSGELAPPRRPGQARPHGRAAAPDPAARRPRPEAPGAGHGRVDPPGHQDRRRRDHRDLDAGAVRLHRRPAHRPDRRPVRWRAAPLPAAAAAARPSPTCCCSTSRPTTSTSRPSTSSRTSSTAGPAPWSWSPTTATSSSASPTRSGRCSATARSRCCRAASTSTSSAAPPTLHRRVRTRRRGSTVATADVDGAGRRRRQRRGARGPQGAGPDRQAARADRRAGGRAERRDRRARARTTSGSPSCPRSSTSWPPRRTSSSWSGSRPPRSSVGASTPNGASRVRSSPASLARSRSGRSARSVRSASSSAVEGVVDGRLALGGEPHEHAAPVVGVGEPLDQPARGEPVDPVGHRPAGHQRLAQQPAGGELVRRAGAAQRGQHVELPRLDLGGGERLAAGQVEVAGEPGDPAEDRDRARGRGPGARAPTPRPARRPRPAWREA